MDAAIADGATEIDEIADLIRGEGGACSRSAVGRYTKNVRDLIRQQQETDRDEIVGAGARRARRGSRGTHPDRDPADDDALHHGRTQPARDAADAGRAWPPGAGSQAHRGYRQAPARAGAGGGEGGPGRARRGAGPPGQAPPRKGLSPEAVAAIREVVEGRPRPPGRAASAPVDPWNPSESHLIPLNPGESRPENVSVFFHFPQRRARLRSRRAMRSAAPCRARGLPARTGSGVSGRPTRLAGCRARGECPEQVP